MQIRSHADVRSTYFRQACSEAIHLDSWDLATFRIVWRRADIQARFWRQAALNRYNHSTRTWSGGNPNENAGYRSAMNDAGRGHLLR